MEKWVIAAKRADFNQIGQQFHIDPVIDETDQEQRCDRRR